MRLQPLVLLSCPVQHFLLISRKLLNRNYKLLAFNRLKIDDLTFPTTIG
jgi:hypothetical protein